MLATGGAGNVIKAGKVAVAITAAVGAGTAAYDLYQGQSLNDSLKHGALNGGVVGMSFLARRPDRAIGAMAAVDYALASHSATAAESAAVTANEGIYEFTAASTNTYVGQSGNITVRVQQHLASGKLLPKDFGTVHATEVLGGKTAREVAEQLRILERGGVENLENIRNPIGPARAKLLPKWARDQLNYK